MRDEIYHKDNLKVLGTLFKQYREEMGYSLRGIARSNNLAHTVISDIENGKNHPNTETLKELFDTLSVPVYLDEAFLLEMKAVLDAFDIALYHMDYENAKEAYERLRSNKKRLLHSPLRIDYLLTVSIYETMVNKKDGRESLEQLEGFHECMSKKQRQLYNLTRGIRAYRNRAYHEGLDYLWANLEAKADERFHVLTLYFVALINDKLFRNHLCIQRANEASKFFTKHNNTLRKMEMESLKAKKFIDVSDLETAAQTLRNLENIARLHEDQPTFNVRIKVLKAYLAYSEKRYQSALAFLEQINVKKPVYHFLKAVIYFVLDEAESGKKYLLKTVALEKDHPESQFVSSAYLLLDYSGETVDEKKLEESIDKLLKDPYGFVNIRLHYFVLDMIINYYEQRKKHKKALEVAKIWLVITKDRDFYATPTIYSRLKS